MIQMDKFIKLCSEKAIRKLGASAAAICIGFLLVKWRKRRYIRNKVLKLRNHEKLVVENQLQKYKNKDVTENKYILSMNVTDLVDAAQKGKLSPVDILNTYMKEAYQVTQKLNCITGIISNADKVAYDLRNIAAEQCMLYGVPVSLKENMKTKGNNSTIGLSVLVGIPALDDCVIAKVLKHCGAIPYVKTNLSQMMFSYESSNPIYGETSNPLNAEFAPGGSSSGEASLIGGGGSPLGFGTDIGGSIRVPAHLCGITGFKPTKNRLSTLGLRVCLPGQTLINATVGPMAKDVDTLVLAMRAVLCPLMFELDPNVAPLPFNETMYNDKKRLRIGYYVDDGYSEPIPAVKRAVTFAKEMLIRAGHTLVPFEVPRIADIMRIAISAIHADGGKTNMTRLKFDVVDEGLHNSYQRWKYSRLTRWFLSSAIGLKWPRVAQEIALSGGGDCSVFRLWKLQAETFEYKEEFFKIWKQKELDAVICPAFPLAACPKGSLGYLESLMSYTILYNILNCPGGVVPVTRVNITDIEALNSYVGHFGDVADKKMKEACKSSLNMPVAVQCVALPWQEEKCLRVMKEVESWVAYQ